MLTPVPGEVRLSARQRRDAEGVDGMLRRIGVRCLWRAAIVTEMLRDQGMPAHIRLSVKVEDPRIAHAECEIGGSTIRTSGHDMVKLR